MLYNDAWVNTYADIQPNASREQLKKVADKRRGPEWTVKQMKLLQSMKDAPSTVYYKAIRHDGVVQGFLCGTRIDDSTTELDKLYIARAFHGKGMANALIEDFLNWNDKPTIMLSVVVGNQRAQRFYEKYGFRRIDGSEHVYPGGFLEVFDMKREV